MVSVNMPERTATVSGEYSQNIALIIASRAGDEDAEALLVERNSGLVNRIALRFRGRGIEFEDLIQIGTLGLIKAARSFDIDRGFAFSTYAVPLIMGEIKRSLRDDGLIKVGRAQKKLGFDLLGVRTKIINEEGRDPTILELSSALGVSKEEAAMALDAISPVSSLSAPADDDNNLTLESRLPDSDNEIEATRDRVAISQAIAKLPEIHRKIVDLRFYKNKTQQETAEELGLSQVKVSREEKKILEFLRFELI